MDGLIEVVSCVGMPIRDNLYWLEQSDYFIAPLGAGLAKLCWVQNKPGFVLLSRLNLSYCSLLHAYDDERFMEPPFTKLDFNDQSDAIDLSLIWWMSQNRRLLNGRSRTQKDSFSMKLRLYLELSGP